MKKLRALASLLVVGALPVASYGFTSIAEEPVGGVHVEPIDSWVVDAPHTEINFSVKHFFTPVTGTFDDFELTLDYDAENPENSRVEVRIAVASVNTGNEQRDDHLRTAAFFAADEHPYITFRSTSVSKKSDGTLVARGPLSIRGTTKEVELPIKLLGIQPIPEEMREMLGGAREIASFQMSTTVDRRAFGVGTGSWAATMVVGGEVTIDILVEAHRK
jgi:polyisoprenoid-binding protein YceI